MKKIFKKKISLFGKEISMFAVVVVAMIAIASAALVPYLSGMVTGTTTINAPLTLIGGHDINSENINFINWADSQFVPIDTVLASGNVLLDGQTHNGEYSTTIWVKATNNADKIIEGYVVFEINNSIKIDRAEVQEIIPSINVFDWAHDSGPTNARVNTISLAGFDGSCDVGGDSAVCNIICSTDGKTCRVYIKTYLWNTAGKNIEYVEIPVKFPLNALGKYEIRGAIFDSSKLSDIQAIETPLVFPTA